MAWLHDQPRHLDPQHHLQAASRAFHSNKLILCDKGRSIWHRFQYFKKGISPVDCFGASHRAIHKDDLAKLDAQFACQMVQHSRCFCTRSCKKKIMGEAYGRCRNRIFFVYWNSALQHIANQTCHQLTSLSRSGVDGRRVAVGTLDWLKWIAQSIRDAKNRYDHVRQATMHSNVSTAVGKFRLTISRHWEARSKGQT